MRPRPTTKLIANGVTSKFKKTSFCFHAVRIEMIFIMVALFSIEARMIRMQSFLSAANAL